MATTTITNTLNIVKQASQSCGGEHVDPEHTFVNGAWLKTDNRYEGPIVETLYRNEGETDEQFFQRADKRASEIDRANNCYQCYQK